MKRLNTFTAIRDYIVAEHKLVIDEDFVIAIDYDIEDQQRKQSIFLAEIEGREGDLFLRVETTIAPLDSFDAEKCLRLNLMLRNGYLAVGDLDGVPYIKMCENILYDFLNEKLLRRQIDRIARLADEIEKTLAEGADFS
ncbi:MAG: hypothetical protein PF630_12400 [Gammaproteobacteria bacterium]|jgi:hypothetical protein|nr:hypothetical protein [Gammaproteobacteria bacterium]